MKSLHAVLRVLIAGLLGLASTVLVAWIPMFVELPWVDGRGWQACRSVDDSAYVVCSWSEWIGKTTVEKRCLSHGVDEESEGDGRVVVSWPGFSYRNVRLDWGEEVPTFQARKLSEGYEWSEVRTGFPMRALMMGEVILHGGCSVGHLERVGAFRVRWLLGERFDPMRESLPVEPLYGGLACNSVIYGAGWWAVVPWYGRWRRAVRWRGRLCARCGYSLQGLCDQAVCSECGRRNQPAQEVLRMGLIVPDVVRVRRWGMRLFFWALWGLAVAYGIAAIVPLSGAIGAAPVLNRSCKVRVAPPGEINGYDFGVWWYDGLLTTRYRSLVVRRGGTPRPMDWWAERELWPGLQPWLAEGCWSTPSTEELGTVECERFAVAFGWPMRCCWMRLHADEFLSGAEAWTPMAEPGEVFDADQAALPRALVWSNFMIDGAFWGSVSWGTYGVVRVIRRVRRRSVVG